MAKPPLQTQAVPYFFALSEKVLLFGVNERMFVRWGKRYKAAQQFALPFLWHPVQVIHCISAVVNQLPVGQGSRLYSLHIFLHACSASFEDFIISKRSSTRF